MTAEHMRWGFDPASGESYAERAAYLDLIRQQRLVTQAAINATAVGPVTAETPSQLATYGGEN